MTTTDTSGAVGQNVKQMRGLWEVRARFEAGSGYLPCILLWPGTERDSAAKATWPSWKEYDLVECGGDRRGGNCNVHYGTTNTQTGPHHFDGDLTQWHVYGCELHDTGVRYYLDGKVVKELTGPNVTSNHIHRLGIQLDVGRSNRVSGDVRLLVDWVRVKKFAA